jgi:hypothetical protein
VIRRALAVLAACGAALGAAIVAACDEPGQPLLVGANEPIRVRGAQLISGALPGSPPVDLGDAAAPEAGAPDAGPPQGLVVTDIESADPVVLPGASAKKITGRVTDTGVAVAMRIADLGTGYWVLPVSIPDPQFPGEITFEANVDFNQFIPPGSHMLRVVGIDANGVAGTQRDFKLCIASRVPDNLNACDPTNAPPDAVISLQWDADVDLDLQVTTPDGRVVEPKHPLVVPIDAGRPDPNAALIDRDSLAACVPDGRRQEDLIFPKRPTGTWTIAANLFDNCKQPGVRFEVVVYEAQGDGQARHLVETFRRAGHLADIDANGGARPGLFVVDYPFGD